MPPHVFLLPAVFPIQQDDQEDVSPGLAEQQWDKKLPEPLTWRSDEEDEDSDFGEEQRDCYLKVLCEGFRVHSSEALSLCYSWITGMGTYSVPKYLWASASQLWYLSLSKVI